MIRRDVLGKMKIGDQRITNGEFVWRMNEDVGPAF